MNTTQHQLTGQEDDIMQLLIDGFTYRDIAKRLDVSLSSLHDFLSKPEHFARVALALKFSADSFADLGEQVLKEAPADKIELMRARELAQHYRWKAAKRDPRRYSEKMDITSDGEKMTVPIIHIKPLDDRTFTEAE